MVVFFFNDTSPTEIYPLSLHDALPILAPEFGAGKIFRPNRDVRFSNDKSPYKTAIGATVGQGGYIQLSARGLGAGAGMWIDRKSTRLNSSHANISYAVFCLKKKNRTVL